MHVDFYFASTSRDAIKNRFPEIVAAFFYSAFAMDSECYSADAGTLLQNHSNGVPAVGSVCFGCKAFNCAIRIRTIDPNITMHPEAELKLHPACNGFLADEFQQLEISFALRVRQLGNPYVVPGH